MDAAWAEFFVADEDGTGERGFLIHRSGMHVQYRVGPDGSVTFDPAAFEERWFLDREYIRARNAVGLF